MKNTENKTISMKLLSTNKAEELLLHYQDPNKIVEMIKEGKFDELVPGFCGLIIVNRNVKPANKPAAAPKPPKEKKEKPAKVEKTTKKPEVKKTDKKTDKPADDKPAKKPVAKKLTKPTKK